jgi:hypothetical protein
MTYSRITFLRQNFRREGAKRGEIFSRESQGTRGKKFPAQEPKCSALVLIFIMN